jgi:BirA family biotin operon repressor/biotin-[acetyl-CoA-carboxylase] ligase
MQTKAAPSGEWIPTGIHNQQCKYQQTDASKVGNGGFGRRRSIHSIESKPFYGCMHPQFLMSYSNMRTSVTSAEKIRAYLAQIPSAADHMDIRAVVETGSTNVDLLAAIDTLSVPTLLVADQQTAGRGRAGRTWHSAPATSLTFSMAWPMASQTQSLAGLSLAIGVVIAETLGTLGIPLALKWPNDLLRDGAKLGGILIEMANSRQSVPKKRWAVIGIGLNLGMSRDLAAQIGREVASAPELQQWERETLLAQLAAKLAEGMRLFEQAGFSAFAARWNALHAYTGQAVVIMNADVVLHEGRAVGIDDNGQLLIDTAHGRIAVAAGDVSLRLHASLKENHAAIH